MKIKQTTTVALLFAIFPLLLVSCMACMQTTIQDDTDNLYTFDYDLSSFKLGYEIKNSTGGLTRTLGFVVKPGADAARGHSTGI